MASFACTALQFSHPRCVIPRHPSVVICLPVNIACMCVSAFFFLVDSVSFLALLSMRITDNLLFVFFSSSSAFPFLNPFVISTPVASYAGLPSAPVLLLISLFMLYIFPSLSSLITPPLLLHIYLFHSQKQKKKKRGKRGTTRLTD